MNTTFLGRLACLCLLPAGFSLAAFAQTTAFTYQGVLQSVGGQASGSTDFTFTLCDAASGAYSSAMGNGNTASGEYSTALGVATQASGERSTAAGFLTIAPGFCTVDADGVALTAIQG